MKRTPAATRTDSLHPLEYTEGQEAFERDECINPYTDDKSKRLAWWNGYLDARTFVRLGHVFKRRGIQWP